MRSVIVSDTTALIILSKLHRFDLLSNLFERVVLPKVVYEELTVKESVELPDFFEIHQQSTPISFDLLVLDAGEAAAIALAEQLQLPLLIDEKKGRRIAQARKLVIFGTLGLIIANTKRGYLTQDEAIQLIDRLASVNFRLSESLLTEAKAIITAS